jgi:hypothetical protein
VIFLILAAILAAGLVSAAAVLAPRSSRRAVS